MTISILTFISIDSSLKNSTRIFLFELYHKVLDFPILILYDVKYSYFGIIKCYISLLYIYIHINIYLLQFIKLLFINYVH